MKIFLDDERKCPKNWTIARCTDNLDALIEEHGIENISDISLDNDLGIACEDEGRQWLNRLLEKVLLDDIVPPVIHIHTANPIASNAMVACRRDIQRILNDNNIKKDIIGGVYHGISGYAKEFYSK